jgi:hypothetical protein
MNKNMNLINAKQLSKELHDYQIRLLKGGIADFQGIGDFIANQAKNYQGEDGGLIRFMGSMGGDACLHSHYYWSFRDHIHEYQLKNNISSVAFQEVNWDGVIIRYPEMEDQLEQMPQDKAIVCQYRDKVVDWFIKFADNYLTTKGYKLLIPDDDGYRDGDVEITTSYLKELSKEYEWASLTQYTPRITPVSSSEMLADDKYIDKGISYWMREFHLFLYRGFGFWQEDNETQSIILYIQWRTEPTELSL